MPRPNSRATYCRSPTIWAARSPRSARSSARTRNSSPSSGLEATERELMSVFERHGITRIAAIGLPLDPNQHQAMLEIPSDKDAGTIVQEMQAGYMMKDRLLRPAMVGVAKKAD